jgi:excisionase family DNA binding protein
MHESANDSIWLTVREAARIARTSEKTIYSEIRAGRLRASRVTGRATGTYRLRADWVEQWLIASAPPVRTSVAPRTGTAAREA